MKILDLLGGIAIIAVTFLGLQFALIGALAWDWSWWAIGLSLLACAIGVVAWYGGLRGDSVNDRNFATEAEIRAVEQEADEE